MKQRGVEASRSAMFGKIRTQDVCYRTCVRLNCRAKEMRGGLLHVPLSRILLGAKPDMDRSNWHTAILSSEVKVLQYFWWLDRYWSTA